MAVQGGQVMHTPTKKSKAWRESPEAARAFEAYYDLGDDRRLSALAEVYWQRSDKTRDHEKFINSRVSQFKKWSSWHKWQNRVIEYDRKAAERKHKKREREQERMNEAHAELGEGLALLSAEHIEHLRKSGKLSSQATVLLFKYATDLQRNAVGAATETTHMEVSGEGGGPVQTDGTMKIMVYLPKKDAPPGQLALPAQGETSA